MNEGKIKVLLCDDSKFARASFRNLLLKLGVDDVTEAQDGEEAVQKFLEVRPDIAFIDIEMPNTGGVDALKKIRMADPKAKAVMLSSPGTQDCLKEALDAGTLDFLQKPVTEEGLSKFFEKHGFCATN